MILEITCVVALIGAVVGAPPLVDYSIDSYKKRKNPTKLICQESTKTLILLRESMRTQPNEWSFFSDPFLKIHGTFCIRHTNGIWVMVTLGAPKIKVDSTDIDTSQVDSNTVSQFTEAVRFLVEYAEKQKLQKLNKDIAARIIGEKVERPKALLEGPPVDKKTGWPTPLYIQTHGSTNTL